MLFERLHERGFREARRRLGEVLLGLERDERDHVAFVHRRQHVIVVVRLHVVRAFLVHGHVARLHQRGAVRAQHVPLRAIRAGEHVDGDGVEHRVTHLRGDGALPDERIELELIRDRACSRCPPARWPRRSGEWLRALPARSSISSCRRAALRPLRRAVELRGDFTDLAHGFVRERHGVRAHIGDEADGAFADVHAFIELLREAHGAAGVEAELARGFLLQRRRGERRRRIAAPLLAIDGEHASEPSASPEAPALRAALISVCSTSRAEPAFTKLNCSTFVPLYSMSFSGKRCSVCSPSPSSVQYSCGTNARDLFFALADHAQRGALHAAGGEAAPHFLPEQRREIEADEIVERAPRLLRVHEIERQVARLGHRLAHRGLGDLVEHHAMHLLVRELAALFQDLRQMPGDGFALAVRVGREVQGLGFLQRLGDGFDVALVLLEHLVLHGEAVVGIDRAFLRHQIAHVAIGGEHLEVLAQVLLDGLRLRGRLDDDEIVSHPCAASAELDEGQKRKTADEPRACNYVKRTRVNGARPCACRRPDPRAARTRAAGPAGSKAPSAPPT